MASTRRTRRRKIIEQNEREETSTTSVDVGDRDWRLNPRKISNGAAVLNYRAQNSRKQLRLDNCSSRPLEADSEGSHESSAGNSSEESSVVEVQIRDNHRMASRAVLDKRIVDRTRKSYDAAIKKLIEWLQVEYPRCVEENSKGVHLKLPLSVDVFLAYLSSVQYVHENGQQTATLRSGSFMNTVASALKDYYKERGLNRGEAFEVQLSKFMAGHRRMLAIAKQDGSMNPVEGKRPITFHGYHKLAKFAILQQSSRTGSLFAHLFIVLSWNLFARSHSVAELLYNHFEWKEDSLLVTVPKHKGDQEGVKIYPVHVFANPLCPEVCPVLALAIYVFCTYTSDETDGLKWCLFKGAKQEQRFSNWLSDLLKSNEFDAKDLGALASELGTHSFRFDTNKYCSIYRYF